MSDEKPLGGGFAELVGLGVKVLEPGFCHCTLDFGPQVINEWGIVHGGALFTLADTGMGAAVFRTLGPGETCATIEMKISYFKPASQGPIDCVCRLLSRGRNVAYLEAVITTDEVEVARATASFAIIRRGDKAQAPSV